MSGNYVMIDEPSALAPMEELASFLMLCDFRIETETDANVIRQWQDAKSSVQATYRKRGGGSSRGRTVDDGSAFEVVTE